MSVTIKTWIENAVHSLEAVTDTPRLDAQLIIAQVLFRDRSWILGHLDEPVSLDQLSTADALLLEEMGGKPLPYLLGHWEFYGLDFIITPDVLIPRPETELLVEKALEWLQARKSHCVIADIGTGSGCIAISIASHYRDCEIIATDISEKGLSVAQLNASKYGLFERIHFVRTNLMDGLNHTFDLVFANLPYIPKSRLDQLTVSKSEPLSALDGGSEGLELITEFLIQVKEKLSPKGCILAEIDLTQSSQLIDFARKLFPQKKVDVIPDLANLPRLLRIK